MPDKLALYNDALGHLGERRLASLSENREPRRALDDQWDLCLRWTLEQAPWSFAIRAGALPSVAADAPPYGFLAAYPKPADWLKTVDIAYDEFFRSPLRDYRDQDGHWYANGGTLYVRYVSIDTGWGTNPDRWTPSFADLLALRLAEKTCRRITGAESMLGDLVKLRKDALNRAKANDALNTPPVEPPVGAWAMARRGRTGNRGFLGDGGSDTGGLNPIVGPAPLPAPVSPPAVTIALDVQES